MRVDLGVVGDFPRLPALVEVRGGYYYLCRRGRRWFLLSTLCPHQGGEVLWKEGEEEFVCPLHG